MELFRIDIDALGEGAYGEERPPLAAGDPVKAENFSSVENDFKGLNVELVLQIALLLVLLLLL